MPKLRVFSDAELCDLLAQQGFQRVRQRGSHAIMSRGPVSGPLHRGVDRGTLAAIIRQSGLPRSLFEAGMFNAFLNHERDFHLHSIPFKKSAVSIVSTAPTLFHYTSP
jgi:predicted RNA binding protein YcfA (HicA-like mRNA interferase family)